MARCRDYAARAAWRTVAVVVVGSACCAGRAWALPQHIKPLQHQWCRSRLRAVPPAPSFLGPVPPVRAGGDGETGRLKGGGAVAVRKASIGHTIVFGTLYFLSIALAIPALPNLVNSLVSVDASVSGAGQMKLSSLLSTDAFFTLLTTNIWATMSDKYGRKPFLAMSSTGIGIGAAIIALAPTLKPMYIAAAIDGTNSPKSCMV